MDATKKIELLLIGIGVLGAIVGYCVFKWGWHHGAAFAFRQAAKDVQRLCDVPMFSISPDGKSITCHVCGMTSWSAGDVREKYCGHCHVFHEDRARMLKSDGHRWMRVEI